MMNSSLIEDIAALEAMYCLPGEVTIEDSGRSITVNVTTEASACPVSAAVTFHLDSNYPYSVPDISIVSALLTRSDVKQIRERLSSRPCSSDMPTTLLDLVSDIKEGIGTVILDMQMADLKESRSKGNNSCATSDDEAWTMLLHLDHMRAKGKYVKTITKWAAELSLSGRLLFCHRLIFILLQGQRANLKEYICRQRSVNVDVDSRGQPCKERMLSVLCEEVLENEKVRIPDFQTMHCSSMKNLEAIFRQAQLQDMYVIHVKRASIGNK